MASGVAYLPEPATALGGSSPLKERSVGWYQNQIRLGLEYQRIYGRVQDWQRYRGYYRHQWPRWGGRAVLPVNIVFSQIRSLIPQVYPRNPRALATSRRPGSEARAMIVESLDNLLIQELGFKRQVKKMILDAAVCGSAGGYVGYDSEFGFDPANLTLDGTSTATMFDRKGYRTEYSAFVNPGMPWFLRDEPENTVFPWGTKDPTNVEMIFTRCVRPLRDFKADPKYVHTGKLAGSFIGSPAGTGVVDGFYQRMHEQQELVEFWQIRDFKTGEILVVTMQCEKFHRREPDELQIDGPMMHWLTFNEDPQLPWGIPDVRIIEPQQLELNETRTLSMKHRRAALLKLLYRQGAVNKEEIEKLLDEDVKAAVAVNDAAGRIADAVVPIRTEVPMDLTMWGETIRQDIREMIGFSRNQAGEFQGKTHISATEVGTVSGANLIRVDERRDQVADLMTAVLRNINQVIFKFWNEERVQRVTGPLGIPVWVRYSAEDLRGEYDIRIDVTESAPVSQATRKSDAVELMRVWNEVTAGKVPMPGELARFVFKQYEGINVDALMAQLAAVGIVEQGAGMTAANPMSMQQFEGAMGQAYKMDQIQRVLQQQRGAPGASESIEVGGGGGGESASSDAE